MAIFIFSTIYRFLADIAGRVVRTWNGYACRVAAFFDNRKLSAAAGEIQWHKSLGKRGKGRAAGARFFTA